MRKYLMLRHAPGRARTCNPMIRSHILWWMGGCWPSIEAEMPEGLHTVVRTVTVNSHGLKFTSSGFETE